MTEPYTPTTAEVKEAFVDFRCDHSNEPLTFEEATSAFSRWLAAHDADHDADVKAEAWDEGYSRGMKDGDSFFSPNPYREVGNLSTRGGENR